MLRRHSAMRFVLIWTCYKVYLQLPSLDEWVEQLNRNIELERIGEEYC